MALRKQKSRKDQVTELASDYLKLDAVGKAAHRVHGRDLDAEPDDGVRPPIGDVGSGDGDRSPRGAGEAGDDVEQCALAGAVGADDAKYLTCIDLDAV